MRLIDSLPLFEMQEGTALSARLVQRLKGRGWVNREELAKELFVSVRVIRSAASHASGQILSGARGLKLTSEASSDEVNESIGRMLSQVREMRRRIAETETVWHRRGL